MTKVTWLGDGSDSDESEWNGQTFKKGEAVDVKDERMVEKAKGNPYFKVAGDKSPTVEDNPISPPVPGRADDQVKNISFGSDRELQAHRENSIARSEQHAEFVERAESGSRRRGRPPGSGKKAEAGGSKAANEMTPPKATAPLPSERYPSSEGAL